jgi:hypothetical protein
MHEPPGENMSLHPTRSLSSTNAPGGNPSSDEVSYCSSGIESDTHCSKGSYQASLSVEISDAIFLVLLRAMTSITLLCTTGIPFRPH